MKRWYIFVIGAYGACVSFLIFFADFIAFLPHESIRTFLGAWRDSWIQNAWTYGGFLALTMLLEAGFLLIPMRLASMRPVKKRHIAGTLIASGCMAGALVFGTIFAIGETVIRSGEGDFIAWIAWGGLLATWIIWAKIFYRESKRLPPEGLIKKQSRWLLRGSILEFLIAIPTHILARNRDYCCAGYMTFIGIALGIAVLLFSFGPGILFLYVRRYQEKTRKTQIPA